MATTAKNAARPAPKNSPDTIVHARTICLPADRVFEFCINPETISLLLATPDEPGPAVTSRSQKELTLTTASGDEVQVRIVEAKPAKSIAWSCATEGFEHRGTMVLSPAPGDEGTEVSVTLLHDQTRLGGALDKLNKSSPDQRAAEALRRLKALLEAGEIPTIKGQSVGEPQKSKGKK